MAASMSRIGDTEEDGEDRSPLLGLFPTEILPLSEIVQPLRPKLSAGIDSALLKAKRKADELKQLYPRLTSDERAMLTLYTMELQPREQSLYFRMNEALRARDRSAVKEWRYAIWLLLTAMHKLPRQTDNVVYRAMKKGAGALGRQTTKDANFLWCSFTSTTTHLEGLRDFLGEHGSRTLFTIKLRMNGVSLQPFSLFPDEYEIVLPPQMEFKVISKLETGNGLTMVQCQQIKETDPLMDFGEAMQQGIDWRLVGGVAAQVAGIAGKAVLGLTSSAAAGVASGVGHVARRIVASGTSKGKSGDLEDIDLKANISETAKTEAKKCRNILQAAEKGNLLAVKHFLSTQPESIEKRGDHGMTPLHVAASHSHAAVTRLLLSCRADVNTKNDAGGFTSLHQASLYGHVDTVKCLLEFRANVWAKCSLGKTPLHYAQKKEVRDLIERPPKPKPPAAMVPKAAPEAKKCFGCKDLTTAAQSGNLPAVKEFLNHPASLEENALRTSLYWAVRLGHPSVVKCLLDAGAAVNGWMVNGCSRETALHVALRVTDSPSHVMQSIVGHLLLARADIFSKDESGVTPLQLAGSKGVVLIG